MDNNFENGVEDKDLESINDGEVALVADSDSSLRLIVTNGAQGVENPKSASLILYSLYSLVTNKHPLVNEMVLVANQIMEKKKVEKTAQH